MKSAPKVDSRLKVTTQGERMAFSNLKSTTGHLKYVESSKSKEKRVTFNYINKPQTIQNPKIKNEGRVVIGASNVIY